MRFCPRCRSTFVGEAEFCSIDGQRLVESEDDPLIGERVGRYEFVEMIGTGAMGAVYRVRHTELERDFAIKVLFGELGANRSIVARFRREAKAMSRIDHPNVVSVIDFGATEHGLNFLVMEWIPGHALEDLLLERKSLAPRHAAWITREIAAGLSEAHRLGFVHRDVKPANVMLTGPEGSERVQVLDFGIVGMTEGVQSTKLTGTGRIVGTPRYMSPEQARAADVGPAADLYSLGVIVYEMLTGDVPFPGEVLADVLVMHSTVEPAPLPEAEGLGAIAHDLLAKRPEDRPISAWAVVERIDRLFAILPAVPSEDEVPTERPRPVSGVAPPPGHPLQRSTSYPRPVGWSSDFSSSAVRFDIPPLAEDDGPAGSTPRLFAPDASQVKATQGGVGPAVRAESEVAVPRDTSYLWAGGSLIVLGISAALILARSGPPGTNTAEALLEGPRPTPVLPLLVPIQTYELPVVASAAESTRPGRRRRVVRRSRPNPGGEAPQLSVPELEVTLGHALRRRGLSLEDLSYFRATRGLWRSWRNAREDQTEQEATKILVGLIEASRKVRLSRRFLKTKARRIKKEITKARPRLTDARLAELSKEVRALERRSKRASRSDYEPIAISLDGINQLLHTRNP